MEYETITQLISNVGFPIAACIALFYICKTFIDRLMKVQDDNAKALQDMNATLVKLDSTLDKIYNKIDSLDDRISSIEKTGQHVSR